MDLFAYIDLAQRGRTGVWPAVRGGLWIILYIVLAIVLGVGLVFVERSNTDFMDTLSEIPEGKAGPVVELALALYQTIAILLGVWFATVWSQRRPFLTLITAGSRIDGRRILLGAAAWLVASLVASIVFALAALLTGDDLQQVMPAWHVPDARWLWALVLGLAVIPLQAAGEELLFRGWLTQTIGQFLRRPWAVAIIVGVLFALVHTLAPAGMLYFTVVSLGLSALTLSDGRLELAIGAHTAQNLFVLLIATPFLQGDGEPTLFGAKDQTIGLIAIASAALQFALVYVFATDRRVMRLFGVAPD